MTRALTGLLAVVAALVMSGAPAAGNEESVAGNLAGPWRYLPHEGPADLCAPSVDDSRWATMQLPSSWFLLGRSEYPPKARADQPLPGTISGGTELPEPDPDKGLDYAGTVYFRRTVDWQQEAGTFGIIDLDMVDYYVDVVINGVSVGRHEGYFQRFSLDATSALRPGANLICLKVSAPPQVVDMEQQHAIGWPKAQDQIKGVFGYHDARPGGTSARGQSRSTGGVLRSLSLRHSRGVDLERVTVTPLDVSERSARLVIEATLRNWGTQPVDATVEAFIAAPGPRPRVVLHLAAHAEPGLTAVRTEVKIDKPALWWTWDRGPQPLYQLNASAVVGGEPGPPRNVRFGVRSVTRDADWVIRLNGQRLYLRGTNYIATQWLSQVPHGIDYGRDLSRMKDAHLNAFRVHGHVARRELYEHADSMGFLVWQDFPLQWGYADTPAFHEEALKQAGEMIDQLRSHPSIFLWCMHNEAPYAMDWMKKRLPDQNRALDDKLVALAAATDPSRIAHRDSGTGDGHYYFGWYHDTAGTLRPLPKFIAPLVSEYGAQALPSKASLERTLEARSLWPTTDDQWEAWRFANFQPVPTFIVAKVDRGANLDEFVAHSQAYQAALLRFQTEVLRRAKWTRTTGLFQFMFVDPWPAITWSVIDYFREPKAGYAALQSAMQPVLPSIDYQIDDPAVPLALHVVNDRPVAYRGARLRWSFLDAGGQRTGGGDQRLTVEADSAALVVDLGPHPAIATGAERLTVELVDSSGKPLGASSLSSADYFPRPAKR